MLLYVGYTAANKSGMESARNKSNAKSAQIPSHQRITATRDTAYKKAAATRDAEYKKDIAMYFAAYKKEVATRDAEYKKDIAIYDATYKIDEDVRSAYTDALNYCMNQCGTVSTNANGTNSCPYDCLYWGGQAHLAEYIGQNGPFPGQSSGNTSIY
jgi:hypothetical protein